MQEITVALSGNPNVGKSTVFNSLTGLKQHTGNWTGKTVATAKGKCKYENENFVLIDLPGTYSLISNSKEEELARDYLCFSKPDAVIVVADATCLERNLNLVLQILEITKNVVLCVNLIDEAKKKQIEINFDLLETFLDIPVVSFCAKTDDPCILLNAVVKVISRPSKFKLIYDKQIENSVNAITDDIKKITRDTISERFVALKLLENDKKIIASIENFLNSDLDSTTITSLAAALKDFDGCFQKQITTSLVNFSESIAQKTITFKKPDYLEKTRKIDKVLTSKLYGIPIMIGLLAIVFFITIIGANYPSLWLSKFFEFIENQLNGFFNLINTPYFIQAPLMDGIYKTTAWVVSVMLPPMAIFFPLFCLLEDLGYLPRVAFNLDNRFKKSGACGKQSLCMCMGFGCNAAGVVGTRIIDSDKEKLIAVLTNNFVPCNGRFPTLITVSSLFIGGTIAAGILGGLFSALSLTIIVLAGIIATFIVSKFLSKTFLRGQPSSFILELPPYRKPQILRTLVRSFKDKTIFVLLRAIIVAMPAGLIIWLMANININGLSLLAHMAMFLDPFAKLMGLDGYIFTAFFLSFPANEILLPIVIMSYTNGGVLTEFSTLPELSNLLVSNGWTIFTGISVLIFTLFHFPCATTCLTIKKETASFKWTILAFLLPTIIGIGLCMGFTAIVNILF